MFTHKELPENGEIVLVKIKKVMPFGAYCEFVEYKNIEAYLPIKEVAPGWIKNIHEFIREGQQAVAKVIFVDHEKRAVDISLKKVSKKEEKEKIDSYNTEKRSEKLFKQAIVAAKKEAQEAEIEKTLSSTFISYSEIIESVSEGKDIGNVDSNFKSALSEIVAKNVKPKRYKVAYTAKILVYDTKDGINKIKKLLNDVSKLGVNVLYLGAPHYKFTSEDSNFPDAENRIKKAQDLLNKEIKSIGGVVELKKEKE
ncbi:MAG: S1 RNA-binding domain-containing protein [Candidatus Micrarchaeia archaeon]